MSKIIFTNEKTDKTFGYVGGGVEYFPKEFWSKIPDSPAYMTHLLTLYPNFYHESEKIKNHRISIFLSLEPHKLGGVKSSLTDKFTINQQDEVNKIHNDYAVAVFYEIDTSIDEYNLSEFNLPRKYMNEMDLSSLEYKEYCESEHIFFEEHGMGLDESKIHGIFYFEQDRVILPPKYSSLLQLLEEDIEASLKIFQHGIGYFFLDRNIKKLNHGDRAGVFFIQN